jgi:hypothetical protein
MTVEELRELLEEFEDGAEIRIATQPSWPLQFRIAGVVGEEIDYEEMEGEWQLEHEDCDGVRFDTNVCETHNTSLDETINENEDEAPQVVYVVEGGHPSDDSPYASSELWNRI